jgi:ABC-type amino acid transport substrate-binding protein
VQKDTSHEAFLENTDIQAIGFPKLSDALLALSGGKIDAVVANLAASAYLIRKLNLINLKIAAPASPEVCTFHFAVRNDWPELVSILNKMLARIPRTAPRN